MITAAELQLTSALSVARCLLLGEAGRAWGLGEALWDEDWSGLFFFFSLSFIFPVIMSALQYLMTAHLFRQFQVAPLEGEGDSGGRGTVFCVGFFVSFFDVIVLKRRGAW